MYIYTHTFKYQKLKGRSSFHEHIEANAIEEKKLLQALKKRKKEITRALNTL